MSLPVKHPLVPAALLFLLGVTLSNLLHLPSSVTLPGAVILWLAWAVAEWRGRPTAALALLCAAVTLAGSAVWSLNQYNVEAAHIARFTRADDERAVTLRATVVVPPEPGSFNNPGWIARADALLTNSDWLAITGDLLVQAPLGPALHVGDRVELYGWLSRPAPPSNPGAADRRAQLAADRVFAQLRVPRATGVVIVAGTGAPEPWLTRLRLAVRAKLLRHLALEDVPAAYTLTALLLGYRDPVINSVSQAFSDAGVAHLLAISGSHIVFFTALVWGLLRLIPMRPCWRDWLIALAVGLYILVTPCGPPIVRAAVTLVLVLLSRQSSRPPQYLNMLAAAAILILCLRPADIESAGFQLSFIATLGLIVFAPRLYHFLFDRWIEREELVVELSQSRFLRRRLNAAKLLAGLFVANVIGALTAAPLVAFHFGQVNLWAIVAGLIALPAVMLAMIGVALQLIAEGISSSLGAAFVPVAASLGDALVWIVEHLAALPGAALAVRAPPGWSIALAYAAITLWAVRKRFSISRAMALNACLAATGLTAAWYALTLPTGHLQITVFDAGQASSMLIRTPRGDLWAIDAGAPRRADARALFTPALRVAGSRSLRGLVVSAFDTRHAAGAADLASITHPAAVFVPQPLWSHRHETFAGESLDRGGLAINQLHAGQSVDLGGGAKMTVLWPPLNVRSPARTDLIVLCTFADQAVLIADPAALPVITLTIPTLRADVIIFTGPQRGEPDAALRTLIAPLQARTIIWTDRTVWAPRESAPGEFNTRNGAITIDISKNPPQLTQQNH